MLLTGGAGTQLNGLVKLAGRGWLIAGAQPEMSFISDSAVMEPGCVRNGLALVRAACWSVRIADSFARRWGGNAGMSSSAGSTWASVFRTSSRLR
jgi:hypothetical protein